MTEQVWNNVVARCKLYRQKQEHLDSIVGRSCPLYVSNPDIHINGLTYIPDFISEDEENAIVDTVYRNPFSTAISRRQQFYGEIYYHTTHDLASIQPAVDIDSNSNQLPPVLPMTEFDWLIAKLYEPWIYQAIKPSTDGKYVYRGIERTYDPTPAGIFEHPVAEKINNINNENVASKSLSSEDDSTDAPTQILVNEYRGKKGISTHIDDPDAFGRVIAIISVCNPIVMILGHGLTTDFPVIEQKILLQPRSLLVMKGDSRYLWRHAISKAMWLSYPLESTNINEAKELRIIDGNDGKPWVMTRREPDFCRVSLTIRKLLNGRKQVTSSDKGFVVMDK